MSFTFDTMQQALELLRGDEDVKVNLRFTISRLHDFDHQHEGILNRFAGTVAGKLDRAIAAALAAEEGNLSWQYIAESCPGRPCGLGCDHRGAPPKDGG